VIIREAQLPDLPGILKLYSQLHKDDPKISDGRSNVIFEQILESDNLMLFIGVLQNFIVSTCYLNLIPNLTRGGSAYGVIENVVTDSRHRNEGYGKMMIKHALSMAWDRGCYKVMLQAGSRNPATHQFYQSCGFLADEKFAFIARPKESGL